LWHPPHTEGSAWSFRDTESKERVTGAVVTHVSLGSRYGASGCSKLSRPRSDGTVGAPPPNAAVNAAARSVAGRAWRYRLVVVSCECPMASLMLTRSTPPATSSDPKVWRG